MVNGRAVKGAVVNVSRGSEIPCVDCIVFHSARHFLATSGHSVTLAYSLELD